MRNECVLLLFFSLTWLAADDAAIDCRRVIRRFGSAVDGSFFNEVRFEDERVELLLPPPLFEIFVELLLLLLFRLEFVSGN